MLGSLSRSLPSSIAPWSLPVTVTSAVASFALVAGLLTIVPGLDTALVLRSAIIHGKKYAFATALGINCGALVWGIGAAVGVSALLAASTLAYTSLCVVGAAYMVWLGGRLIWTGAIRRPTGPDADSSTGVGAPGDSVWRSFRRGLLTNLLNPMSASLKWPHLEPRHPGAKSGCRETGAQARSPQA